MKEFIIIFRECLEAGLIVGIIYTFIHVNRIERQKRNLWLGVLGGIIASILVGCIFFFLGGHINSEYETLFEGVSMYITAVFLFYVIFWLSKKVSDKSLIEKSVQKSISRNESWGLFMLILFAILREGFEIIILLFKEIKNGELNYFGIFSALILAVSIIYLIFILGKRVPVRKFFASTTLLLVFIAAGLVAYGTHEVEEYLVDSGQIEEESIGRVWNILQPIDKIDVFEDYDTAWDYKLVDGNWYAREKGNNKWHDILEFQGSIDKLNIAYQNIVNRMTFYSFNEDKGKYYHLLHDKGKVGDFLKGFFGYNSNPNYVEFFLWLLFLIFGLKKWADFYYLGPPKK